MRILYQRRSRPPPPPPPPPPPKERPPPPPPRFSCGVSSLTVKARPCSSSPLNFSIAACASCVLLISTKPNPRDWPVNLSEITFAEVTAPTWPNNPSSSVPVALKGRFPTNNFVAIPTSKNIHKGPRNHEYGSRGLHILEPTRSQEKTTTRAP